MAPLISLQLFRQSALHVSFAISALHESKAVNMAKWAGMLRCTATLRIKAPTLPLTHGFFIASGRKSRHSCLQPISILQLSKTDFINAPVSGSSALTNFHILHSFMSGSLIAIEYSLMSCHWVHLSLFKFSLG